MMRVHLYRNNTEKNNILKKYEFYKIMNHSVIACVFFIFTEIRNLKKKHQSF